MLDSCWLVESKDAEPEDTEPEDTESWLYHTLYYKRVEHSLILVSEGGPGTNPSQIQMDDYT